MKIVGPTRLILLRAGKYDYAEVELIRPLHLIGPNNVGKTSLISALQFLYIDDQRQMHFSRDMDQTRRYYFPDPNSYIFFECLTPTGYRVIAVQGLGPVKSYGFTRFSYQGEFVLDDFVDEHRQVRPEDVVKSRLVDRGYTTLEPAQLKAALTGLGDNKGVHLGLLPMRNRGGYGRFRKVFSNLLRLAHLSQEDLKRSLFEIHESDFQQSVIDLEAGYSSQYEKVRAMAQEIRDFKAVADDIHHALTLADQRNHLRAVLPQLFSAIENAFAFAKNETTRARESITRQQEQLNIQEGQITKEQQETQDKLGLLHQQLGVLKKSLVTLQQEKEEFAAFMVSFEVARLTHLKSEIEGIVYNLKNAHREPVERVAARIGKKERELKNQEKLLAGVAHAFATRLKELCSEGELTDIFRLVNPDILGLAIGPEGLEIISDERLREKIHDLLGRIQQGVYLDDVVKVMLTSLTPPSLEDYSDPLVIADRVRELKDGITQDKETLRAAEESEKLKNRKKVLEKEWNDLQEKHRRFSIFQGNCAREKDWTKEHDLLVAQKEDLEKRLEDMRKEQSAIKDQQRQLVGQLDTFKRREEGLLNRIRALSPPDPEWVGAGDLEFSYRLDDLIQNYSASYAEQKSLKERLDDKLLAIEGRTYSRNKGENEAETLRILAEELDALAQKEEAAEKLWSGLTANLQSAIKSMLKDLETLKSKVEELNRQLARVSVSNLSRLRLMVAENHQLVPTLKTVASKEDSPLFNNPQNIENALSFIGEFLKYSGKIELLQLFELQFEVNTPDGNSQRYTKLENIESNGTTITIKVLINLMLLRGLLDERKEVTIPFYLDEASSLDRDNVTAIVKQSVKMGFTPILASPEAMDAADHLYFLRDREGRLLLESNALVRINRGKDRSEKISNG